MRTENHVTMRIAFVVNRHRGLRPGHTTTHLAAAALRAGLRTLFIDIGEFSLDPTGRLLARAHEAPETCDDPRSLAGAARAGRLEEGLVDIECLDGLILRNNPVQRTVLDLARLARDRGLPVLNDPDGVAAGASKATLATLPVHLRPATVVSRDVEVLLAFLERLGHRGVLKPVRGFGGRGVIPIEPGDEGLLVDYVQRARRRPDGYVVLQQYLPQTTGGDKRIVLVDGEPVGSYLRLRREGEFRHNLHAGGRPLPGDLDDGDRALCRALAGILRRDGIFLAGLDVIGGLAVEVNVVAPGGVANIERLTGRPVADRIMSRLIRRLADARARVGFDGTAPEWIGAPSRC